VIAFVVVTTPIVIALFKLIAAHDRRALVAEKEAHQQTKSEIKELKIELDKLRHHEIEASANPHTEHETWKEIELSEEEQMVLVAISSGYFNRLVRSNRITQQRYNL
jgi:hypothetical protein